MNGDCTQDLSAFLVSDTMLNKAQSQFTEKALIDLVNSPSHFDCNHTYTSILCATLVGQDNFSGVNYNSKFAAIG